MNARLNAWLNARRSAMWVTTWIVMGFGVFGGCDNPVTVSSTHIEAMELVVRDSSRREIDRTVGNQHWQNAAGLVLTLDAPQMLRVGLLDIRGEEFTLDAYPSHTIRVEVEPANLLDWEPLGSFGRLSGLVAGRGRLRFLIWHVSHPDFITPWMTVEVVRRPP